MNLLKASCIMDTRVSNQLPPMPVSNTRIDPPSVRSAVPTDLPVPAAISAQVGSEQTRWSRSNRKDGPEAGLLPRSESSFELDRETGDLIYKVIDPESRTTVMQYPYESTLRLRAYIRAEDDLPRK